MKSRWLILAVIALLAFCWMPGNAASLLDAGADRSNPPQAAASDAGRIVYASMATPGQTDIFTVDPDGSNQVRLTSSPGENSAPSWSPDGTRIAFTSNRDNSKGEIYAMAADGTQVVRLTTNDLWDLTPAWSPDGSRIAFAQTVDGFYQIFTIPAAGGSPTRLTFFPQGSAYNPCWSPDGSRIAFFMASSDNPNGDIYVMKADGSGLQRLTDSPQQDTSPCWSPDGSQIAFASNRNGTSRIYLMAPDGSGQTLLTAGPGDEYSPCWSPDSQQVVFVRLEGEIVHLYRISLEWTAPAVLIPTGGQWETLPRWTGWGLPHITLAQPTGWEGWTLGSQRVVQWRSSRLTDLVRLEINRAFPGGPWEILAENLPSAGGWSWMVDGSRSATCRIRAASMITPTLCATSGQDFALLDPLLDPYLQLLAPTGGEIWAEGSSQSITWTSRLAASTVSIELSRDGGRTWQTLFASTANDGSEPWTVTGPPSSTCRLRVRDSAVHPLQDGSAFDFAITRSPATGEILFASERDGGPLQLYRMKSDGSSQHRIAATTSGDRQPSAGPDGTRIAFSTSRISPGTFSVFTENVDGSYPSFVATGSEPTFGPRIAFVASGDGNDEIWSINPDGSDLHRLTTHPASDRMPAWSPDGTHLVFASSRDNPLGGDQIYRMNADGSGITRLTNGAWSDDEPAWSPDGMRIAFSSSRADPVYGNDEIYLMNTDGSGLVRLTSNPASDEHPTWSPDGSQLAFQSFRDGNWEIYRINFDGSGLTRLTNSPGWDVDPNWAGGNVPKLELLAPLGGESWTVGESVSIRWSAEGLQEVCVEISRNNGWSWDVLFLRVPNLGMVNWTVETPTSNYCLIRLSAPDYPGIQARSPRPFEITNLLRSGVPISGLSGTEGSRRSYQFVVPASSLTSVQPKVSLTFTANGGSGDCDLFLRYGSPATPTSWDYSSTGPGTEHRISITPTSSPIPLQAGGWHLLVLGASSYNGVTLEVQYQTGSVTLNLPLVAGWNMISLPVTPASSNPNVVFGGLPSGWVMYAWDAANGRYIGKEQIVLGLTAGYWLKVSAAVSYPVTGQPNGAAQTGIDLGLGWNLIGVPYEGAIPWGAVRVSKDGGALCTLDQAIASNWIQAMLFRWQGNAYQGLTTGGIFQPLSGYWAKTKVTGVRLVFLQP